MDETAYQEWLHVGLGCAAGDFLVKVRDLHSTFYLFDSYFIEFMHQSAMRKEIETQMVR